MRYRPCVRSLDKLAHVNECSRFSGWLSLDWVSAALNSRGLGAVFGVFCAHAVNGHPAAALPIRVMKLRRFTNQCLPRFRKRIARLGPGRRCCSAGSPSAP